jgi:hypothetical protein
MTHDMSWRKIVETQNAKTFTLPAGWTPRAKVADELECSEDRVNHILRPSIKAGSVLVQQFRVWDKTAKRIVLVTAYREKHAAPASAK